MTVEQEVMVVLVEEAGQAFLEPAADVPPAVVIFMMLRKLSVHQSRRYWKT